MENSHNLCVTWQGETCSNVTGHVIMLDLEDLNLEGIISPEVLRLKILEVLDLSWNERTGPLPKEFGLMKKLKKLILDLSYNFLSGDIPSFSNNLLNNLNNNMFSGSIPVRIGQLGGIQFIDLSNNKFTGYIPTILAFIKFKLSCIG
ncbi:hypothetical protein SELMODRAFT_128621 [Selaginella moellendorffii]|uniref:Leucine-rich repeat-containing N-terminal plant-type domain-containing protein n=1 Tax=Selaginella moellendorffii TaxID=88036 RepID=D8SZC0_SELML|nr:hypothetical protein SELMODRAFT_128621 [Selaginella moellendorffii]